MTYNSSGLTNAFPRPYEPMQSKEHQFSDSDCGPFLLILQSILASFADQSNGFGVFRVRKQILI